MAVAPPKLFALVMASTLALGGCPSDPAPTVADTGVDATTDADSVTGDAADIGDAADAPGDTPPDTPMPDGVDAADTAVDTGPVTPPATPAGAKLYFFLLVVNDLGGSLFTEDLDANFTDSFRHARSDKTIRNAFPYWSQRLAPLTLVSIAPGSTDHRLLAQVTDKLGTYHQIPLKVEQTLPYRITNVWLGQAPQADPVHGLAPAGHVPIEVADPSNGQNVGGATVELVDAATGASFDPPISGVADDTYAYLTLPKPPGGGSYGLRATHPDGFVTTTYGLMAEAGLPAGTAHLAPAFAKTALPFYLEHQTLTGDPAKGHVWGRARRESLPDIYAKWLPNVGCATVTSTPSAALVYSNSETSSLGDPAMTSTDRDNSTWWNFNIDPVSHTYAVDAGGGKTTNVTIPPPVPGEMTVVLAHFTVAEHPLHPQRDGCQIRPIPGVWDFAATSASTGCQPWQNAFVYVNQAQDGAVLLGNPDSVKVSCPLAEDGTFTCPTAQGISPQIAELFHLGLASYKFSGRFMDDGTAELDFVKTLECTGDAACDTYATANSLTFPCEETVNGTSAHVQRDMTPLKLLPCSEESNSALTTVTDLYYMEVTNGSGEDRVFHTLDVNGARSEVLVLAPGAMATFATLDTMVFAVTNTAGECQTLVASAPMSAGEIP